MARLPRLCPAGIPVLITHRGHDRKVCFADGSDYLSYLELLTEGVGHYGVDVHAWTLMTNHVRLRLRTVEDPIATGV